MVKYKNLFKKNMLTFFYNLINDTLRMRPLRRMEVKHDTICSRGAVNALNCFFFSDSFINPYVVKGFDNTTFTLILTLTVLVGILCTKIHGRLYKKALYAYILDGHGKIFETLKWVTTT